jgi:uncharacterized protein YuzE
LAWLEFDGEINAMYVTLIQGKVYSTEPLADNIMVDLDKRRRVLGFELLLSPTLKKELKAELVSNVRKQSRSKREPVPRPTHSMFK